MVSFALILAIHFPLTSSLVAQVFSARFSQTLWFLRDVINIADSYQDVVWVIISRFKFPFLHFEVHKGTSCDATYFIHSWPGVRIPLLHNSFARHQICS